MWNFGDGFDFWNGVADAINGAGPATWDTFAVGGNAFLTGANTRFGVGQSMGFNYQSTYTKSVANNDQTHHFVFALKRGVNAAATSCLCAFTLYDVAGVQCSVALMMDGSVRVYSGAGANTGGSGTVPGGSLLATSPILFPSAAVWYGIEIEVKISNTAGQVKVRVNGNSSDDYASAATLNTRNGGTGNDYANKLQISDQGGSYAAGTTSPFDDFLWFTTAGAAPNTWVGDIRSVQQMPVSDAQQQLTPFPATATLGWTGTNSNTGGIAANTLKTSQAFTYAAYGTVTNLSVWFSANYTGKFKLGLYLIVGTSISTLLAQTAEVTNATAGAFVTVPVIAPYRIVPGTKIVIGLIVDSAASLQEDQAGSNNVAISNTYTSGFPSPGSSTLSGNFGMIGNAIVQPDCAMQVLDLIENGDTTYVAGSTAGLNDFYNLGALSTTPSSIIGVQTKMLMRKDDAGAKQAKLQTKSGATVSNGPTVALSTSYLYTSRLDTVDPATSAAWTAAGVNGYQIGPYVVA